MFCACAKLASTDKSRSPIILAIDSQFFKIEAEVGRNSSGKPGIAHTTWFSRRKIIDHVHIVLVKGGADPTARITISLPNLLGGSVALG
jgi:hypothetical protein